MIRDLYRTNRWQLGLAVMGLSAAAEIAILLLK